MMLIDDLLSILNGSYTRNITFKGTTPYNQSSPDPIESTSCNLLSSSNPTSALAEKWENIPETLLLNGMIGLILFMIFLILTYVANNRSNSEDDIIDNGLISFLYGYRDPERWYVIPRLEFLRRSDKHHKHDQECTKIYVPPKLPLANPLDLLAYESDVSRSLDAESSMRGRNIKSLKSPSPTQVGKSTDIERQALDNEPSTSHKSTAKSMEDNGISIKKLTVSKSVANAPAFSTQPKRANQTEEGRLTELDQSFYYPTILSANQLQASYLSRKLNQFFSSFFRVTDSDIIYAKGIDAYEYLLFQRHLIFILFLTNILCIGLILPIHWLLGETPTEANKLVLTTSFQRTTIKNLGYTSNHYWVHIVSSVAIVAITVSVLNSYRESTITKNDTQLARRTLLVGNIPVEQRNRVKLKEIFGEYFRTSKVEAIQFVYNISKLERYQLQLDSVRVAKRYCEHYKRKYNRDIMVKQTDVNESQYCNGNCRLCSFCYVCCFYWPRESKQSGIVFYTQQEQICQEKIKKICDSLVKKPSEYAFITFKTYRQAKRVMEKLTRLKTEALLEKYSGSFGSKIRQVHFNLEKSFESSDRKNAVRRAANNPDLLVTDGREPGDPMDPKNNPHVRSIRSPAMRKVKGILSKRLEGTASTKSIGLKSSLSGVAKLEGPLMWSIRYAPHPDNVEYYDLLNFSSASKYTTILLHFLMIVIFLFITTPNVVLSILERWSVLKPDETTLLTGFQGELINYLTVLVQIITTAVLPALIVLISKLIPYEDSASKEHSVMWKTYFFLVLMVIVMPSIGMNSAQALLSGNINPRCLFPTDNGAYFINYVVTSIFLSTILELIKPIDIISYWFILGTSRSSVDFESGRQFLSREFSVGLQHTSVLLVFAVVMTYTISCPLIAPAGLVYLLVKHSVDHYNIYYTYFPKKVDKNCENTVEIFVRVALLLMLFQTLVAISINTGTSYFSLLAQIVFWVTLAVLLSNCFVDCTSRALRNHTTGRFKFQREFCACYYLPRVIEDLLRSNAMPSECISRDV